MRDLAEQRGDHLQHSRISIRWGTHGRIRLPWRRPRTLTDREYQRLRTVVAIIREIGPLKPAAATSSSRSYPPMAMWW